MSLLRCEWKRLFARRLTRFMILIVLVLMVAIASAIAASTHRINDADRAAAARMVAQQEGYRQQGVQQCQQAVNAGIMNLPPGETCESQVAGSFSPGEFLPRPWTFATDAPQAILIFGGLFAMFAFLVGASFVGAEWTSGGMMNLLLWRPRRRPVLAGKVIGLGTAVAAVGVGLAAAWLGLLCAIASTRGVYGHVTNGFLRSLGLDGARALLLGIAAGLIGFAIASLGRHTSAALGVVVGYAVVWEIGFRLLTSASSNMIERPERFLLTEYVTAWMRNGYRIDRYVCAQGSGQCVENVWKMTLSSALEVGAIVTAALLAWAFWSFRRRDVA